jgi:uroporphyrinogen decarboxylase
MNKREAMVMNGLTRVQATVRFEAADRVPVIAQVFAHAAAMAGKTIYDYVRSGRVAADCQIQALARYGYDAVFAFLDANVETEALGSRLTYRPNEYPYVQSYGVSKETNLENVSIPDPLRTGRMPEMLDALTILRAEVGDKALVVGCALGPMTLAFQLIGTETALYLAVDDPEGFDRFLDFSTRVLIRYATAQVESGAHALLVFDPGASPAVIPAGFFREFELPRLKTVFAALDSAGALAGWLHIAGPTGSILPFCSTSGADIINFDYCVDPGVVMSRAPSICCDGNIKSIDFVEAQPEKILSDSQRLMDLFAGRGGFILSSGCEIPPESRPENVDALVSAARRLPR